MRYALTLVIAILVSPGLGRAMTGVQICPDNHRVMISKDVGDERWAIMYDMNDHTAIGNVFFASGGPPAFVWCTETGDDGNPDPRELQRTFSCSGADACPAEPCSANQWKPIGAVTLPGGFFMPPMMSGPGMLGPGMMSSDTAASMQR